SRRRWFCWVWAGFCCGNAQGKQNRFLISHSKQGEDLFSLFFCQNIRGHLTGAYRTCCRRD
ncbi:MAG TPA: hypothetical protein PLP49_11020, partial [Anaerohalosphaeraceae bacterium]|nr:hypothetical protein [Anaerohalosphaeraceae bacterium]